MRTDSPPGGRRSRVLIMLAVLLVLAAGVAAWQWHLRERTPAGPQLPTFSARRGPLVISVTVSGTIQAKDQIVLKNELEGTSSILYLIPEGTQVKKGELLVELDASNLQDRLVDQQIAVQNAEAAFVRAREDLAVIKNQAESDVEKAELTQRFAKEDQKNYEDGEFPNALKAAESKITIAAEELQRRAENLKWSRVLFEEKYLSETELQADELAEKKARLELELAQSERDLLRDFTYRRRRAELESDVKQAEMALERTRRKAAADVVQAEAQLKAKEAEHKRQLEKLTKIKDQISKAKIYAPADGLVVHATTGRGHFWHGSEEPLAEGQQVREREELIQLPTAEAMIAEAKIHEADLTKVVPGLPVQVTVDALPGQEFTGTVGHIAPLPDATSVFLNPDLKVYDCDIELSGKVELLRTGMSCRAEIIVETFDTAVYVPLQALTRLKGKDTLYVMEGGKPEPRTVTAGLDNNRMVRITEGLKEGEEVLLTPPLTAVAEHRQHPGGGRPARAEMPGQPAGGPGGGPGGGASGAREAGQRAPGGAAGEGGERPAGGGAPGAGAERRGHRPKNANGNGPPPGGSANSSRRPRSAGDAAPRPPQGSQ